MVYTGAFAVEWASRKIIAQVCAKKRGNIFDHVLTGNQLTPTSTVFLRRQCIEKVGLFDDSLTYGEDYDMWLRISREFHFDYISQPLVAFSLHDGQASLSGNCDNYEAVIRSIEAQLTKYAQLLAANSKAHSVRYIALGDLYCCSGNIEKGREALLKAIKLHPMHIRHYYNLALSLLGAENFKRFKEVKNRISSALRVML